MSLPLLGGMIFGVLGEIAMGARFLDRVDDRGPLELEPLDLLGQRPMALCRLTDTKINWGVAARPLGTSAKGEGTLLITDSLAIFKGTGSSQ